MVRELLGIFKVVVVSTMNEDEFLEVRKYLFFIILNPETREHRCVNLKFYKS